MIANDTVHYHTLLNAAKLAEQYFAIVSEKTMTRDLKRKAHHSSKS